MDNKPISDLHCHPSLKPFGNNEINTIWENYSNKEPKKLFKKVSVRKWMINVVLKKMATYSQSNLDSCFIGNNRLVFCSIYPIERPFLKPNRPFNTGTRLHGLILRMIFKRKEEKRSFDIDKKIVALLTGISIQHAASLIDPIHDDTINTIDYYNDYLQEYNYLLEANNTKSNKTIQGKQPEFKLVKNYNDFIEKKADNVVCGIVTIEGMHGLGVYRKNDLFYTESIDDLPIEAQNRLKKSFTDNVNAIKQEEFPPFFITFAHHFNNLLAGHAKSFMDAKGTFDPGFSNIFDQKIGEDRGISDFGIELINNYLLSRANGQRILIDLKHMSIRSRKMYYTILESRRQANDALQENVPVIISHSAVNGISTFKKALDNLDSYALDKDAYVSQWDINLTDEDIVEIFKSDGLIGVCMHDGRMPGQRFRKKLKKAKKDKELINKLHVQMFLTNVFHIVKVNLAYIRKENETRTTSKIDEIEAWKTVCLGTDNDGIIDPFDNYNTAAHLPLFRAKIVETLTNYVLPQNSGYNVLNLPSENEFSLQELDDLMINQPFVDAMDKVFYNNTDAFLQKYFSKHYLTQTEADLIL